MNYGPNENIVDKKKFIRTKIEQIYLIIQNTFHSLETNKHKCSAIFSNSEINICYDNFKQIQDILHTINKSIDSNSNQTLDEIIERLQVVYNKISKIFSSVGTKIITDIFCIVFGCDYNPLDQAHLYAKDGVLTNHFVGSNALDDKYNIIQKYISPTGYVNKSWNANTVFSNDICQCKLTDTTLKLEHAHIMDCFPIIYTNTNKISLYQYAFGVRVVFHNKKQSRTLIINGLVDNIPLYGLLNNSFIYDRIKQVKDRINSSTEDEMILNRWIDTLTLKDLLVYSTNDLYKIFKSIETDVEYAKKTQINAIVNRFISMNLASKRDFLIHLMIYNKDHEIQYIAYLLYDLVGSTNNTENENKDQTDLHNSLPYTIKQYFKETISTTIKYNYEKMRNNSTSSNKISLEQQILLLRANDVIKEKAIVKLKEIKGKPDEQCGKTKQYLEGLVKIPFGIYLCEPILTKISEVNDMFQMLIKMDPSNLNSALTKSKYTLYEIFHYLGKFNENIQTKIFEEIRSHFQQPKISKSHLIKIKMMMNKESGGKVVLSTKKKEIIQSIIEYSKIINNAAQVLSIIQETSPLLKLMQHKYAITRELSGVDKSIKQMKDRLDLSIYGHNNAKNQILKVISQWMNGEQNGYCFGFEGSPGIGKTSLAKRGLAKCLQNEAGISRPFSFIALGGSCNGSTLEGHNYTYVNATWGKIVDILMDSKCMNPIIYIDELDKVSKTEQGKEIIGILTHLIDYTQNDEFQDKYFSGIPIDLSKALFIFSYNDPEQIDPILLDRIHRVKFDNLTTKDKLVIVKQFVFPEFNKKFGFSDVIQISDEVITAIIEGYTYEPGIRKLKEILFDLYGEINIQLLQTNNETGDLTFPIAIAPEELGTKYLKKSNKITEKTIHQKNQIGIINGMWANALGKGGIIPIETAFYPTNTLLELRLTGLQGDVMKESMNVARSVAWTLLPPETQKTLSETLEKTRNQGLHIHCPEGSVNKDGPSAGAAITLAIYSLFTKTPIRHDASITGEINLQGDITAIGGLEAKILGSIRAGVKMIAYPTANQKDFDEFSVKYPDIISRADLLFVAVNHISKAITLFL